MYMKRFLLIAPLALSACNSQPSVSATNASAAEVAAKVDAAGGSGAFISPGHWQMTMTMKKMDIPGMPPQMAERMKAVMGKPKMHESCVTPEQVKKPSEDFFGGKENGDCRYDKFSMGGGKIDMVMQCKRDGATRLMTMNGTYSPNSYHMSIDSKGEAGGANAMAGMVMQMEMDATRTGDCTGKEQ
jgi:hypothetical protein